MPDFADSDHVDDVYWWYDREGNEHEGMWEDWQRGEVEGVIVHLSDEEMDRRGRSDDGFAEYHGLYFSDEYDLDDFFDDIEEDDSY